MATKKQILARSRNWLKFRLSDITIPKDSMTVPELEVAAKIEKDLKILLGNFNSESSRLGLKVKNRCWCNKIIADSESFCCDEHKY